MAARRKDPKIDADEDAPLNPALRKVNDDSYGADHRATDPMKTVSKGWGNSAIWPAIWATVAILCVVATIILVL